MYVFLTFISIFTYIITQTFIITTEFAEEITILTLDHVRVALFEMTEEKVTLHGILWVKTI